MKLKLTLTAFAFDLGAHARLTRQVSEVWHKQYTTATPATRSAMRTEFVDAFIKGYKSGVRNLTPEMQRNAEMAASQKYHISRDGAKDAGAKPAKSMRLSKDVRALAEAYLANFENVTEAIAALRAVAK